jgi:hypothetical protein
MNKVTLYHFKDNGIQITIEAYFNDETLIIKGHNIGKWVEEVLDDSDYKYETTIDQEELKKLYPLMNVLTGDKDSLLKAIADKYATKFCYSEFNDFLRDYHIRSGGF